MPALPPRASTVNSTSVAPSFEMPIAERALICAYQDLPLEYAPGPPGCNTPSGSYSGIVFTPPVTICAEPATAFHTLTHLLHHAGGSGPFPIGCNFENGLVTRF